MRPQAVAVFPVMLTYSPGSSVAGLHLVGGLEQLRRLAEVESRLEGPEVGLHDQRLARVLLARSSSMVDSMGRV